MSTQLRLAIELRLALSPAHTYRELLAAEAGGWRRLAAVLGFILLANGVGIALIATRRVSLDLVATTTVSWSFLLLIQALGGVALILSAPRRRVPLARAFELLCIGHAPWTLWMLGTGAAAVVWEAGSSLDGTLASVVLPIAWTVVLVFVFARNVLGSTPVGAGLRTAMHQVIVWGLGLSYIAWAAGGWMRIVEALTPWR